MRICQLYHRIYDKEVLKNEMWFHYDSDLCLVF